MKDYIIKKLGGYATIDDAIDSIRENKDKERILTLAVKKLFNTIGYDDILKEENGQWQMKGKFLTEQEKKLLTAEATQFMSTTLWKVLENDIQYQANRKMFILARNEIEMTAGKLWLYTFDALRTRLKSMSKGSGLFNDNK